MLPRLVSLNQSEKQAHKENLKLSLTMASAPLLVLLHILDRAKTKHDMYNRP